MRKLHKAQVLVLFLIFTAGAVAQEWESSGSFRNFAIAGETVFEENYFHLIHRLRNQILFRPDESSEFRLELDNQIRWGSYLDTLQSNLIEGLQRDNYFDLTLNPYSGNELLWHTKIHRLSYRFSQENFDIAIGRQRIAWGTARIWNPTDLFNQVSPMAIEAGEIPGADSIHLVIRPEENTQIELAGSIGKDADDTKWAVRAKRTISSYDISAIAGKVRERTVLGLDFTGYLGDAGFRGEFAWLSDDYREYAQAVLSYEYVFPNSISFLVEYLYNGGNLENFSIANLKSLGSYDAVTTINKHFLGIRTGGQVDQLLAASTVAIFDLEDGSAFLYPNLVYNWKQDIDIMVGIQLFFGEEGEYASYNEAGVMMLTWYF